MAIIDATDSRRDRTGAWYLSALLVAPVLYNVTDEVFGEELALGFLPWSLVALYGAGVFAVMAWIRFRQHEEWAFWVRMWLTAGIIVWLYVLLSGHSGGGNVVAAAVMVPLTFILVRLKRPTWAGIWLSADAFAWAVVGASAFVLLLEVVHLIPTWYDAHGQVGADLLVFDRENYWLPLRNLLGLEGRWGGFTGFPNITGQAGALLAVYGFARPPGRRAAFVTAGLAILLLTDSRTSYAAGAAGLCLLAMLPGWGQAGARVTPARALAAALGIAMGIRVLLKVVADPALTGRMSMWPEFLSLGTNSPLFGSRQSTIDSAISSGDLPGWAHQGHNILIDAFVRYGILGLALTVAFLALAVVLAVGGVRRGIGVGLALLVALIVSCMGDLGIDWTYPSEGLATLLVAVLLSQADPAIRSAVGEAEQSLSTQ